MNNTGFKSGDKVVFCKSSLESGMIDAEEGDVFTVHDVYNRTVSLKELPGDYHKSHFEHYVEKEKVVEEYIPEVGDKVKGFKFDGDYYRVMGYATSMDDVVGKQGTVCHVSEGQFVIDFGDHSWTYPLELAHLAKIEEPSKIEEPAQGLSHENSQIDWQGSQINWQVGQEVFCLLRGKGVVDFVDYEAQWPIRVGFCEGGLESYTEDGKLNYHHKNRCLFFSEPKIIAETKPPKRPFVPAFKKDDMAVAYNGSKDSAVFAVYQEQEDFVQSKDGECYEKCDWKFYKLGEQVKFS